MVHRCKETFAAGLVLCPCCPGCNAMLAIPPTWYNLVQRWYKPGQARPHGGAVLWSNPGVAAQELGGGSGPGGGLPLSSKSSSYEAPKPAEFAVESHPQYAPVRDPSGAVSGQSDGPNRAYARA